MSITWNGVLSDTHNIIITKYPPLNRPQRKADIYNVPGRSGNIIVEYDAYENYIQQYEIIAGGDTDGNAETKYVDVAAWLYQNGYCQLSDSSEPGYYRMAYFIGPMDVENLMTRYGRCTVSFSCMPFRYASTATDITLTASGTISNTYKFASKPLLQVYGTGSFVFNGVTITIASHTYSYLYIDCDSQQVYYDSSTWLGDKVTIGSDYPELSPGSNTVTFTDPTITKIVVSPRWRTL